MPKKLLNKQPPDFKKFILIRGDGIIIANKSFNDLIKLNKFYA